MKKNEVLQELNEMDSPLTGLPRAMPHTVPDGYFEGLVNGALQAARQLTVPTGYFEALPKAMLHAAKSAAASEVVKPKTRVIALPLARRWAAAAALLVAFGIGGALLFNARPSQNPETAIAALPQEDIAEYAAANLDVLDASFAADGALASTHAADAHELSNLSETELEAYLSEEGLLF